jgi:hypothetical protein
MIIGIAGPYSAPTEEQRTTNLEAMNRAAAEVYNKGHIPFIGINTAIPVVNQLKFEHEEERYHAIMKISLALIDQCSALLVIGESRGVELEKQHILSKGLPVFYNLTEIPSGV